MHNRFWRKTSKDHSAGNRFVSYHQPEHDDSANLIHALVKDNKQNTVKIYLNNRVLLSKALSCDSLPEEIWCSQQILARERSSRAQYEVWTSNFRGNLSHIRPEREALLFLLHNAKLAKNCQKRALYANRRPLRRDSIASRDRFRPMEARQNLALNYNNKYL